jgi:hypothetical protein
MPEMLPQMSTYRLVMHPDDRPSGRGLVPADVDDAAAAIGPQSLDNPVFVVHLLRQALEDPPQYAVALRTLTDGRRTDYWADFAWVRERLRDLSMATGVEHPAPGVAYVRFVATGSDEPAMRVDGDLLASAQIVTLALAAATGHWWAYSVGDYTRPEDIDA